MITIDSLKTRWAALNVPSHSRVDPYHPLDLYIGHDAFGSKELLLVIASEVPRLQNCRSIEVETGKRFDGKWAVRFRLVQSSQEEVFLHLCWDLIVSTSKQMSEKNGVVSLLTRFRKWQILMEHGHSGLLSKAVQKGLLGELLFLKQQLLPVYGLSSSLESWVGPNAADRDFVFDDVWYEIKSTDPSSSQVRISSLEQLDVELNGELVILFMERTAAFAHDSVTLQGIVNQLRTMLKTYPGALELFEDKLTAIGFIDRSEYEEDHFVLNGMRRFRVVDDFPRMRKRNLSPSIIGMTYELSIAGLCAWEIPAEEGIRHGTC